MALEMQSLYILAAGSSRAMEAVDRVNNNLANVKSDGFKKMVVREMTQRLDENRGDSRELFAFPRFKESLVSLEQGPLRETQNPLDFAIEGEGFFTFEKGGETLYSRDGKLFLDPEGYLVDEQGAFLLDDGGKRILLDPTKSVELTEDGSIYQEGELVAKVAIQSFDRVEAVGGSYYRGVGNPREGEYRLHQGFLEGSNVDPLMEMAELITAQRRFEIYGNLMRSLDQLNQKSNEIGKA
ncbi:MAG: flagellar hook-basal body protein [Epsilonproteobacteria bacterium]|nr:flagellar biosynthesis protein FlgF [Campylobacterota bacterium]NPA57381.1 flagellar hook-basal body protein [Campylobacterota bacterium]